MCNLICVISFLICVIIPSSAFAFPNKVSTIIETGERVVTDTLEDRDLSGNLDFNRYFLRLDQEISKSTKYNISYEFYWKDYETQDNLDSVSDQVRFGLDHFLNPALIMRLDAEVRAKDYKNTSSSDYVRSNVKIGLEYKHEDLWALRWDNGFINYNYTKSSQDQLKLFTKLSGWRKFFDERLKISSYYKYQNVNQDNPSKDRSENTLNISPSYKLGLPYFSKIGGAWETGRTDTKDSDDEDRDDDLRFKYTKWHIKTEHPIMEKLDTDFKYGQIWRHYQNSLNNYRTWFIENKTDFKLYDDKTRRIKFAVPLEHREGSYVVADTLSYIKNLAGARLSYEVKNNWVLTPSFTFKKYAYHDAPTKNEKQYVAQADFEKELLNDALELKLTYKYVWKDLQYKNDYQLWSVKAGIDYKF